MSSRDRNTCRHYTSGSAKSKVKFNQFKKNLDVISKSRKLSAFFNVVRDGVESKETEAENTEVASHCVVDEAMEESSLPILPFRSATFHDLATFSSQTEAECTASPPNLAILSSSQRDAESTEHDSNSATSSTSQKQNKRKMYSNDIGEWPSNFNLDFWIAKGSSEVQHLNSDVLSSKKEHTIKIFCLSEMDFIKAFVQAKELGLSKEEFITIWETEAKLKLKADEAKVLQLQQNNVPIKTNHHHHHESSLETLLHQQIDKTDTLINGISQLKNRFDLLISNFEEHKLQTRQQIDECGKQFKLLSNRLEFWMATLKVSVTGDSSEERGKDVDIQTPEVESKLQPLAPSFKMTGTDVPDKLAGSEVLTTDSQSYKPRTTNGHREFNLTDACSSVWDLDDRAWKTDDQNNSDGAEANAAGNTRQSYFQGTGKYADAISSMLTEDESPNAQTSSQDNEKAFFSNLTESNGQAGYFQDVLRSNGKRYRDTIKMDPSINLIPPKGAEFFIPNFKEFQSSARDFFTEHLYTRPKACRVRLRLWFNKRGGRLGVHLLVSQGHFDERYKWPMIFQGKGYIFNQGSKTYTRLWTIEPQACSMPEKNKDVTLGASVSLDTSRDPDDDVTAELLMKKRYVSDGDRLLFRWSIKADEIKADQKATDLYFPQSHY